MNAYKQMAKPTTGFAICSPDATHNMLTGDQFGLPGSSLGLRIVYGFQKESQSPSMEV